MPYVIDEEEQKLKRESDKWIRPEEMIDSTKVQMKSLEEFAKGLGYERMWLLGCFMSNDYDNKARKYVSFSTMCLLHNEHYFDGRHTNYFRAPFNFSTYKIRKARAGKIVHIVNLQMSKKTGYVRAASNIVSFTHQEYEGFLDLKYL